MSNQLISEIPNETSSELPPIEELPIEDWTLELHNPQTAPYWLAALIDSAEDAIITKSLQGIITSWNRGAERLFGYRAAEVIGKPISILFPSDQSNEEPAILARLRRGERIEHYETVRIRKDGERINISLTVSPICKPDGTIIGVSKIARDITERKRAEARLRQALHEEEKAKKEAERANQAKSIFLSRMSHELRTPLNAILGFGQILEIENPDERQSESIEHILKAGRHLLGLINDVLDISRVDDGHVDLALEATNVGQVVQEALELVRPLAIEKNIRLVNEVTGDNGHVLADHPRLQQVLLNLLCNAVKYNREDGQVTISAVEAANHHLRIQVVDTGPGIAPQDRGKLFLPFERLNAPKLGIEGTGLGLAISRSLVNAMGGRLEVDGAAGGGSAFYVELPITASPLLHSTNGVSGESVTDTPVKHQKILYIEDNISNYRLLEAVLRHRPQIELLGAMQGSLGLDLARQHHPDLILLDLHLPDIMGYEVLRRLRENPATAEIPVIVVSADATAKQIERLLSPPEGHRGAEAYFTKPLDLRKLLEALDGL